MIKPEDTKLKYSSIFSTTSQIEELQPEFYWIAIQEQDSKETDTLSRSNSRLTNYGSKSSSIERRKEQSKSGKDSSNKMDIEEKDDQLSDRSIQGQQSQQNEHD